MPSDDDREQWPEHAVCARCAAPLTDDYQISPLGLRFCKSCFDGAIQEKVKERAAAIYVKGRCSRCGKSLINGYRLNQFGVLYCLSCFDSSPQASPAPAPDEGDDVAQRESVLKITSLEGALTVLIIVSHLLFFLDFLLSGRLFHGRFFFRPLVALDLLTLILLAIMRRSSTSWRLLAGTLLLTLAFTILVVEQARSILF
jgi:hypothetical protein